MTVVYGGAVMPIVTGGICDLAQSTGFSRFIIVILLVLVLDCDYEYD
ncbi:MAG: hypothetical protein HN341_12370 [Verrucomicrobia bacterium]|nr:hypothetical protein [Verrucomicrobiota bacterium]